LFFDEARERSIKHGGDRSTIHCDG
jgi:hypothetical protein